MWPPISSTLIRGGDEAVLVDTPITIEQSTALADWVAARTTKLSAIYVTHGHGDHWFGATVLLDRFPRARLVALPAVVEEMRAHSTEADLELWRRRFPGQVPSSVTLAEEMSDVVLEIAGDELRAIEVGHTDMDRTTCLYAPSIGLVAAGDAVYNDVYLQLRESNAETRQEWLAALDTIEALAPTAVIAGHKRPERADDPVNIGETRAYIRDFERVMRESDSAMEVYEKMIELYPTRLFTGALWASASQLMDKVGR